MENTQLDVSKILGYKVPETSHSFTSKDSILYALGLGFSNDPLKTEDFSFTYENADDFQVFPTYGPVFSWPNLVEVLSLIPNFNPMMLLHGEERVEVYRPAQPDAKYVSSGEITDVADQGKGMLLTVAFKVYELVGDKRQLAFVNTMSTFIRGLGGFGHKGTPQLVFPKIPDRKPDTVVNMKTNPNQAIIYRLSGDYNPLHIDPSMAAMGNFDKPILHGMCFYGMAAKGATQNILKNNSNLIKVVQARFIGHVFPGETLVFNYWKNGNVIIFNGTTQERGKEIIIGVIELHEKPLL